MAEDRTTEETTEARLRRLSAFSWPGRRRFEEAAAAAETAALEGLERLRAKSPAELSSEREPAGVPDAAGELRHLIFEATEQLRDTIRAETRKLRALLEDERRTIEDARDHLERLIAHPEAAPEPESEADGDGSVAAGEAPGEPLDLNRATHDELCAIGLTGTQASRIIRQRDFWGEFRDVSELDHVPGFPPETRAWLETRLTVAGGSGD
jgi:DNA uptake protein ComE-like DNA-binding protein